MENKYRLLTDHLSEGLLRGLNKLNGIKQIQNNLFLFNLKNFFFFHSPSFEFVSCKLHTFLYTDGYKDIKRFCADKTKRSKCLFEF